MESKIRQALSEQELAEIKIRAQEIMKDREEMKKYLTKDQILLLDSIDHSLERMKQY